jgi:small subunit ribosomal protein S16
MSVCIRLRRIGKNPKGRPYFRIGVFDKHEGRDSRYIEDLGFYNPVTAENKINKERVEHWVKNGAQLSATVKSLIRKLK